MAKSTSLSVFSDSHGLLALAFKSIRYPQQKLQLKKKNWKGTKIELAYPVFITLYIQFYLGELFARRVALDGVSKTKKKILVNLTTQPIIMLPDLTVASVFFCSDTTFSVMDIKGSNKRWIRRGRREAVTANDSFQKWLCFCSLFLYSQHSAFNTRNYKWKGTRKSILLKVAQRSFILLLIVPGSYFVFTLSFAFNCKGKKQHKCKGARNGI